MPSDEQAFQRWYAKQAAAQGLDPDPDAPEHFYDYRAAFKAGASPDKTGHWPSEFKQEGHPRMVIDGVNTKTGERVPGINLEALKASDKFKSLSPETQKAVLGKLGYSDSDDGWETARQAILPALNPNLGMRAGNPFAPGVSSQGTEAITEPVMAGPMGPTYAGDAEVAALTGGAIAAPMAGGAALGALGLARAGSAYSGASQGGKRFGVPGAIVGGVVGALNPVAGGLAGAAEGYEAYGIPGAVLGGIGAAGQIPRLTALLRGAPKAAQVAAKASEVAQAAKAPAAVAQAAAPVVSAVTGGLSGAQRGAIMIREAGKAARAGQKFEGQKIWFALDDAGNPTQLITPGQASRLAESQKTWVKNMWGKGSRP